MKTPKLYFWDTGLACSLLGIQSSDELLHHYARGALFENFVIVEIIKSYYNRGIRPNTYFWRDHAGHEIDMLLDISGKLFPIEIKSGEKLQSGFFKGLQYFNNLTDTKPKDSYLIYGGSQNLESDHGQVRSWQNIPAF